MTAPNKNNVSTAKGLAGGYLYWAPMSAPVPTNYYEELGDAYCNLGYLGPDGMVEGVDSSSSDIKDMNNDVVGDYDEGTTETLKFTVIEVAKDPMSLRYGHENVTESDGMMTIDHNWSKAKEYGHYVAELVLKNGRRWRKVIPEGTVTERSEFNLKSTEVAGSEITIKYISDSTGSGCKDYIQSMDENGEPMQPVQPAPANYPAGDPADSWTVAQIQAYAADNDIDLSGCSNKAEMLAAIAAAQEEGE